MNHISGEFIAKRDYIIWKSRSQILGLRLIYASKNLLKKRSWKRRDRYQIMIRHALTYGGSQCPEEHAKIAKKLVFSSLMKFYMTGSFVSCTQLAVLHVISIQRKVRNAFSAMRRRRGVLRTTILSNQ